jgi:hypothetical protein
MLSVLNISPMAIRSILDGLTPMDDTWMFIAFCIIAIPIVLFIAYNSLFPGIDPRFTIISMLAVVAGGVGIVFLLGAKGK